MFASWNSGRLIGKKTYRTPGPRRPHSGAVFFPQIRPVSEVQLFCLCAAKPWPVRRRREGAGRAGWAGHSAAGAAGRGAAATGLTRVGITVTTPRTDRRRRARLRAAAAGKSHRHVLGVWNSGGAGGLSRLGPLSNQARLLTYYPLGWRLAHAANPHRTHIYFTESMTVLMTSLEIYV